METPAPCPSLWPPYPQLHPLENSYSATETARLMYLPLGSTTVLATSTALDPFSAASCTTSLYRDSRATLLDTSAKGAEGNRWFKRDHDATVSSGSSNSSMYFYDGTISSAFSQGRDFAGNFSGQSIDLQQSLQGFTVNGSSPKVSAPYTNPSHTLASVDVNKHVVLSTGCNIVGAAAETGSTSSQVPQGLYNQTSAIQQQLLLLIQQQQLLDHQEHLIQQVQHKHQMPDFTVAPMAWSPAAAATARAVPDMHLLPAVAPAQRSVDISTHLGSTASLNFQLLQQQQQQQLAGLAGLGATTLPDVEAIATAAGEQAVAFGNHVQRCIPLAGSPKTRQLQDQGTMTINTNTSSKSATTIVISSSEASHPAAAAALPQLANGSIDSTASDNTAGKPAGLFDKSNKSSKSRNPWYKTTLCNNWCETGSCAYGAHCQFAHGGEELLPVVRPLKYKTEFCRTYSRTGSCRYGTNCNFLHGVGDLVNLAGLPVVSSICSTVAVLDDGTDSTAHTGTAVSH